MKTGLVALLFGSERFGLSNEDSSHCHWLMRIPTREAHGSMNLGQAVALCLYELIRERAAAKIGKASQRGSTERDPRAKAGDIERLTMLLYDMLQDSGYVRPRGGRAAVEKLRRMLCRLELSAGDAELWLGMLRQIQWKQGANRKLAQE
jgi:tRNA/rRNA methyltransferase